MGCSRKTRQSFPKEQGLLGSLEENDPVLTLIFVSGRGGITREGLADRVGRACGFAQAVRSIEPVACLSDLIATAKIEAGPLDRAGRLER